MRRRVHGLTKDVQVIIVASIAYDAALPCGTAAIKAMWTGLHWVAGGSSSRPDTLLGSYEVARPVEDVNGSISGA